MLRFVGPLDVAGEAVMIFNAKNEFGEFKDLCFVEYL